jgi:tetrahydromethanopterin S-methyltransferase subunit A
LNSLLELAGQLCKFLLPINEEVIYGNPKSNIAICTLSSMDLLREISKSDLMNKISLVGRLFSENKGIDSLIRYVIRHPVLETIIVCGEEVLGHRAGHALLCIHKYGISNQNRIKNSVSPEPVVDVSELEVQQFQKQIILIDKIGLTDLEKIRVIINQ